MGVLRSSSCLMMSRKPGAGLLGNSEGRAADRGVLMDGRLGVWMVGVLRLGVWIAGVISDGRPGVWTVVGVFRAGSVGFGEAEGMIA